MIQWITWPLVALIVSIAFMLIFKHPLAALLSRLKRASFGKGKLLEFGEAQIDNQDRFRILDRSKGHFATSGINDVTWSNSGNLFWLGHDLMWTMQMALRGAPLETILRGLNQSRYHISHLNLINTPGGVRLTKLIAEAERSEESDWTASKRDALATELDTVLNEVGLLAEFNQPDFQQDVKGWSTASDRLAT